LTWTLLSDAATGARPPARYSHGFTSAGGKLYVHGGHGTIERGKEVLVRVCVWGFVRGIRKGVCFNLKVGGGLEKLPLVKL
jgi:hypothetical protein